MTDAAWNAIFAVAFFGGIAAGIVGLVLLLMQLQPRPRLLSTKCARCSYDLAGIDPLSACPECGTTRAQMQDLQKHRLLKPMAAPVAASTTVTISAVVGAVVMLAAISPRLEAGAHFVAFPCMLGAFLPTVGVVALAASRLTVAQATVISVLGCLFALTSMFLAFMDSFVWGRPDAQAGLVIIAGPIFAAGVSGWGMLIAVLLILWNRRSRVR